MQLENSLGSIREFIYNRYKDNLAGILVLGSANTGNYKGGESDINVMTFLNQASGLDPEGEINLLTKNLKKYKFQSQYFHTLESIEDYIKERGSFSTYLVITARDGSRTIYSSPRFEKLRKDLREHPFIKEDLIEHVKDKDEFEIGENGYMRDSRTGKYRGREYRLTQNLLFHIRRKIQIMNFLKTQKLIFDLDTCIGNIDLAGDKKEKINDLYNLYKLRKSLNNSGQYFNLAKELTQVIEEGDF